MQAPAPLHPGHAYEALPCPTQGVQEKERRKAELKAKRAAFRELLERSK